MSTTFHNLADLHDNYNLTRHAWARMCGRSLSPGMVHGVIKYGRVAYVRGATIYAVGRKEVNRFGRESIDLANLEGVQVVCSNGGAVMTVYRNRDFRGLRPRTRRAHRGTW